MWRVSKRDQTKSLNRIQDKLRVLVILMFRLKINVIKLLFNFYTIKNLLFISIFYQSSQFKYQLSPTCSCKPFRFRCKSNSTTYNAYSTWIIYFVSPLDNRFIVNMHSNVLPYIIYYI